MTTRLTTSPDLTAEERELLEKSSVSEVENFIQANGNELDALTKATRSRNVQAHEILDRKNHEAFQAHVAGRGPNHPPTQGVGIDGGK